MRWEELDHLVEPQGRKITVDLVIDYRIWLDGRRHHRSWVRRMVHCDYFNTLEI